MDVRKIGVIGMGYVGLTMSIVLAERGFQVDGYDINPRLQEKLRKGEAQFHERGLERHLKNALESKLLEIPADIRDCDAYMVCVASPLDEKKNPSTKAVEAATHALVPHLNNNPLIIMRSTLPVGTTRKVVLPILESKGKKCSSDFDLVFAPERTLEGNAIQELYRNPQIIGGYDDKSLQRASTLFRKLTHVIVDVSSLETAEAAKLLDNTSRDFRFGFSNLFAKFCEDSGLDAHEVIKAANDFYPRNNIPLPSPGVGGVCLTKDPRLFVSSSPKTEGLDLILKMREQNEKYPARIANRIISTLMYGKNYTQCSDCKLFLTGFPFKGEPETDDIRDSTALQFLKELETYKIKDIKAYDPVVKSDILSGLGLNAVKSYEEGFQDTDAAIFFNNHPSYKDLDIIELSKKMNKPAVVFDAWRLLDQRIKNVPGISYMSVGL